MMGFDETDLLRLAKNAGFSDITVTLELTSIDQPPFAGVSWSELMKIKPNPNAPTFGEAIRQALSSEQAAILKRTSAHSSRAEPAAVIGVPTPTSPPSSQPPDRALPIRSGSTDLA
jgi:hypothetical protein